VLTDRRTQTFVILVLIAQIPEPQFGNHVEVTLPFVSIMLLSYMGSVEVERYTFVNLNTPWR
jgi:hypothetical protein